MAGFTGVKKDKIGRKTCWRDGKRVPCPKEEKPPKPPKAAKVNVEDLHNEISERLKTGNIDIKELAAKLKALTVKDINGLKAHLGVKASGKKDELVAKLAERAIDQAKTKKVEKPTVDDVVKAIHSAKASDLPEITKQLKALTVKEINLVKAKLGVKASGKKDDLVQKIAERAIAKVTAEPPKEEPTPAVEPPEPEEPKAEAPKAEEPKDELKPEAPKAEEPKAEEPKPEEPKAEEPKAAPSSQVKFDPDLKPEGKAAMKRVGKALQLAKGLTTEQKVEYWNATQRIIKGMPVKAQEMMAKVTFNYFQDFPSLTEGVINSFPADKQDLVKQKLAGTAPAGMYSSYHKGVYLDGARTGEEAERAKNLQRAVGAHEIYAHELSHALDSPPYRVHSDSQEWQKAWQEELKDGQLTEYAADKREEGWAEFGRLLYSGEHDQEEVKNKFPLCWAYWEAQGFTPDIKAKNKMGKGQPMLKEIFGRRIELPDGQHVDCLVEDKQKFTAGFTGKRKDKLGRETCWQNGKRVPCPDEDDLTSRSGRRGKDKEATRGDRRNKRRTPEASRREQQQQEREHQQRVNQSVTLAADSLDQAVAAGTIDRAEADRRGIVLTRMVEDMPPAAMERFSQNLVAYQWYADDAALDAAYRATHPNFPADVVAMGWYNRSGRTIHVAGANGRIYAEEIGHAIDGPNLDISNSEGWRRAYMRERGRVQFPEHASSSRQEWFAYLYTIAMCDEEQWELAEERLPRSTEIVRRYINERREED